ncbi:hypothetical protein PV10_04973 [Exophiala mesophila]|uniref:Leucine-rich repeat-containing protein 40 n=1 Tax=Exophiala mesophila TaxID=212818 RepID=A0A0D1WWL2_EXOME|nr:uncharacterized protein PV10_04973 [Exophiala mesophila]KIV93785.1 hypothetical protein PV10_04973 [Exophiala mesophila]
MDQEHGSNIPPRGSLRLSRLPMPRVMASNDNLRLTAKSSAFALVHHDDPKKNSHLPRPTGPKIPAPLTDSINHSIRSRFNWTGSIRSRSVSPVRDALREAQNASLDTTPPSSTSQAPIFEQGDENPTKDDKHELHRDVANIRKHRPSLSERTVETLSQVSPCPSPVPQKARPVDIHPDIPSPTRPVTSMRVSRQDSRPSTPRSDSPTKSPFRPPGRISPSKDLYALPAVMSPGNIYTPPKAFVKGHRSRIAKPLRDGKTPMENEAPHLAESGSVRSSNTSTSAWTSRTTHRSKTISSHSVKSKPSLASIFKDPPPPVPNTGKLAVSNLEQQKTLLRPRTRGENSIAPSTPPSVASKCRSATEQLEVPKSEIKNSPKSSAALRESIAKARAARKKALDPDASVSHDASAGTSWPAVLADGEGMNHPEHRGVLKRRFNQALASGHLSIQGLSLKRIPNEIMKLYERDNSTVPWSEMVDLVKFTAADNEIEKIEDDIFPDYTTEELMNDDEKTNQFAGLTNVDFHRNLLRDIPIGLRRLERLETLNLSNNHLNNNSLTILGQIPNLKQLSIAENMLSGSFEVAENMFPTLHTIDVQGNKIVAIKAESLANLRSLKSLNCARNMIKTLPWEVLATLPVTTLNASKNRLSGTLFQMNLKLENLRNLDVSYNALEEVSKSGLELPNMQYLNLSGNRFGRLPCLGKCSQLLTLLASENQIAEIPKGFQDLASLKSADFGQNNIKNVDLEIAGMETLTNLILVGNPLREKRYLKMSTSEIKQHLANKLEEKQPEADRDSSTIVSSRAVRFKPCNGVLDLSSQSLTNINMDDLDLEGSDGPVHTVRLSNNDLAIVPMELLTHPAVKYSVRSLDMSHNPLISSGYLSTELFLPSLKSLYVVSTGLASLDSLTTYLKAPELEELNISCHRLAGHVPWVRAWWPNCTTLLATDNWFSSVDTEGVRGLEVLDIRNNEIEVLPAKLGLLGNFVGSAREPGRLKVLEVSGNKFRMPRLAIVEKGTEAILKDLRRMVPDDEVPEEWKETLC